jgi:hypothetical protein
MTKDALKFAVTEYCEQIVSRLKTKSDVTFAIHEVSTPDYNAWRVRMEHQNTRRNTIILFHDTTELWKEKINNLFNSVRGYERFNI